MSGNGWQSGEERKENPFFNFASNELESNVLLLRIVQSAGLRKGKSCKKLSKGVLFDST